MEFTKKNLINRKLFLRKITTPLRITKRITDMRSNFNKIYRNFFLSSTDVKKQKEIEEYLKYQSKLKFKLQNFIKTTKIYFKEKPNVKIRSFKSAKFNVNKKLYFNIIINYDKKFLYQPYLYPINNIIKYNWVTEQSMLNIIKKSKKVSVNIDNKKLIGSSRLKGRFKLNNSIKAKNIVKSPFGKNINLKKLNENNKNKIIKIKKSLNFKNKKNNINNSPSKKKLNLVENIFQPFQNLENVISPIKQAKEINKNVNNKQNIINNYCNEPALINSINSNYPTRNLQENISISSNSYNPLKHSKESFLKKPIYHKINNNKKGIISDNEKLEKNNININSTWKKYTIYDQNKETFKLLPILNQTFNSTMDKSNRLRKNIKTFKREAKIRTSHSKKKTNKITKKYFGLIEIPSMKRTLKMAKSRPLSKEVNKFIYENKKGHIRFNFSYREKRYKSPLTFVEEYNRMRNRRIRTNKRIMSNNEYRALSGNMKENKINTYLGLSFNTNKYY